MSTNVKNWALKNQSSEKLKRVPKLFTLGSHTKQGFTGLHNEIIIIIIIITVIFSELTVFISPFKQTIQTEKLWLDQNFKPLSSLEHSTFYSHIPPSKKAQNP